jgi:hypothetical protein
VRYACEGGIGDSIPGRVGGGIAENGTVGGRVVLGTGTRYHLFGGFGTVRRKRAEEGLEFISQAGRGGIGESVPSGWEGRNRDYN